MAALINTLAAIKLSSSSQNTLFRTPIPTSFTRRRFTVKAADTDTDEVKAQAPDKAPSKDGSSFNQLLGIKGASQEANKWKIRLQLTKPVTWPPLVWGVVCGAAASGNFHWTPEDVAKSILCMIMSGPCLTGYTQTLNDWYDREIDAINEPYRPIPSGAISENEVITQIWVLLLGGLGIAGGLDVWAGHKFPILFYLALGGSLVSYIYSAPPLKLKQNGWIGNFALGSSYISLPWTLKDAIMNKQGKRPISSSSTQKRGYVTWTPQMDAILTSTLFEQMNEGNKGDGDFKPQAYQAVVDKIRSELGMQIMADHAKNRLKVWKKHHSTVTDIRTYTKFKWNDDKKMIEVDSHDIPQWLEYCKENPNASAFLNKRIENWDDICNLVATDRATGDGAEQHEESAAAMEAENEGNSISDGNSTGSSAKKLKRDRLADAVSCFAESFKEFVQSKNPPKPDSKEVYDIVSNVIGLSRHQILKAAKRFLNNTEEFDMLKTLPENEKLDWVLLCLD